MIIAFSLSGVSESNVEAVYAVVKGKGGTLVGYFPNLIAWFDVDAGIDKAAFIASLTAELSQYGVGVLQIKNSGTIQLMPAKDEYLPPLVAAEHAKGNVVFKGNKPF